MPQKISPAYYKAAVIIPHYDDVERLDRCLSALTSNGVADDIEIVVADNGSTQAVADVLAAYSSVRLLHEPQKGAAHARNRGVTETSAPLLWFLDADCVPAPDWLAQADIVARQADIVAGRVEVFDETPPPRSGAEAFETVFAFDCESYVRMGFTVTANLLTSRQVFERTGPFRAGVPEDKEWCLRARSKGADIDYVPNLTVAHPTRQDWPALEKKWRRLVREAWGEFKGHPRARWRWRIRALAVAFSGVAHAPRIISSRRLSGSHERLAALITLLRLRLVRAGWMLRQASGKDI